MDDTERDQLLARIAVLEEENTRLHAFWEVVDSYLARGGDAADFLPLDVLAAWQEVVVGKRTDA